MSNINKESTTSQQRLKERFKRKDKTQDYAKRLNFWLSEPESSVELAHILQSIEDNRKNIEQLPICSSVIVKFTYKAVNTNQAASWFMAIENLIQEYHKFAEKNIPSQLYISKHHCLLRISGYKPDAGECLHKSIELCRNKLEMLEVLFIMAEYYECNSEYKKMKLAIIQCELVSQEILNDQKLARVYMLWGHYYYYMFNFANTRNYLTQAEIKLKALIEKSENQESSWLLHNCLHYIGRTYLENYDFIKAANYYIKAQNILVKSWQQYNLTPSPGSIGFYHLRLAHILEACKITHSAEYHYQQARKSFTEQNDSSGIIHLNLALANLNGDKKFSSPYYQKETFYKREKQIKEQANQALKIGYIRGEGIALLELLQLYVKNRKFHSVVKIIWDIVFSKEVQKLGGILFMMSLTSKLLLKQYYKIRFYWNRNYRPYKTLTVCPCQDPKCKLNQENLG